jgi:hypothetical protein
MVPTRLKKILLEEIGEGTGPVHVIYSIVKDMDPNDVANLFQDVFEQLPGVELTRPDPPAQEAIPDTYQHGGVPGGFREQLSEMIHKAIRKHRLFS